MSGVVEGGRDRFRAAVPVSVDGEPLGVGTPFDALDEQIDLLMRVRPDRVVLGELLPQDVRRVVQGDLRQRPRLRGGDDADVRMVLDEVGKRIDVVLMRVGDECDVHVPFVEQREAG